MGTLSRQQQLKHRRRSYHSASLANASAFPSENVATREHWVSFWQKLVTDGPHSVEARIHQERGDGFAMYEGPQAHPGYGGGHHDQPYRGMYEVGLARVDWSRTIHVWKQRPAPYVSCTNARKNSIVVSAKGCIWLASFHPGYPGKARLAGYGVPCLRSAPRAAKRGTSITGCLVFTWPILISNVPCVPSLYTVYTRHITAVTAANSNEDQLSQLVNF